MLSPQSWLPLAADLQPGHRRRVDHDCGGGRTLLISRSTDGYRAYCFRCNDSGTAKPPTESLAERAARIGAMRASEALLQRSVASGGVCLPLPAVRSIQDWPNHATLWLYKAGLGKAEIGKLGAYYHPPTDRVVLPVYEGEDPVFWQARALDGRQPKYMAPSVDRATVLPRWGSATVPTLTEDILSAFKVGLVAEGWAVMGTRVPAIAISRLLERGCGANVWLDPDPAGQRGAAKIIKQLRAYGVPVRNIVSTKDPKLHTREEIRRYCD